MAISAILLLAATTAEIQLEKKPIPAEARTAIRAVHAAAKAKDLVALRQLMDADFTWSFGGDGDAEQAIEAWKHDPNAIRELYRLTGRRCAYRIDEGNIQCPPNAGYHYRAGFSKTVHGWRMTYFVAGD